VVELPVVKYEEIIGEEARERERKVRHSFSVLSNQ
jgi:hypothetical protein